MLIVEDEPDIAEGLRYNLEREGLRAVVAETGEKGLELALDKTHLPALVLLDRHDPHGLDRDLAVLTPVAALAIAAVARAVWLTGIRHYRSTGS